MEEDKQKLLAKVNDEANELYKRGTNSHTWDLILSYASIIGSALATIFTAGDLLLPKWVWITAVLAAIPGVCMGIQKAADLRGRSSWYFLHGTDHEVLSHNLEFGSITLQDAAKEFGAIKKKWEESWTQYVKTEPGTGRTG